jgi:hypothetical protein
MDSLVPTWDEKAPTLKELRQWVAPLVAGNRQVAPLIAQNMKRRFRLVAVARQLGRRVKGKIRGKAQRREG